jgi:hypothetical protein
VSSAASAKSALNAPLNQDVESELRGSLESFIKPTLQSNKAEASKAEGANKAEISTQEEPILAKGFLRQVLLHRLKELAGDVENEGDLDKMHRQLDCIEGILRILSALER